ncbi:hypothetical protein FA15DRAFT_173029 [Coprinopsis marcescibilis]|uniref:Uncharacterized protein n=1 Tax=Coprinopsis marcescibilis TaxID=230819 RepID=A0A5C3KHR1_COPMA|nr:hypothetical protein FA15DRAFT_173029 [Coprinopsis marcescibilis]
MMGQWLSTPQLPDGEHTLELILAPNSMVMEIDFAVVSGGYAEKYDDETTVIVDDNDTSQILYWGNWDYSTTSPYSYPTVKPYIPFQNGTHIANTVGSGFRFRFLGNSVAIYGVYSRFQRGSFDLTFTIDDGPPELKTFTTPGLYVNETSPQPPSPTEQSIWLPHWQLVEFVSLGPGEHIITVNLTSLENHEFIFDYLTYSPSFPDLASKPIFNVSELAPTPFIPPAPSAPGLPLPAILGGVLGGACTLIIAFGFVFFFVKRKRPASSIPKADHHLALKDITPFDATVTSLGLSQACNKSLGQSGSGASMTQVEDEVYGNTVIGNPKLSQPMRPQNSDESPPDFVDRRSSVDTFGAPPAYRSSFG